MEIDQMGKILFAEIDFNDASEVEKSIERIEDAILQYSKVRLYFTSDGGSLYLADTFLNYLHKRSEHITLVAVGRISSCAVELFVKYDGNKEILKHCQAVLHLYTVNVESRDLLDKKSYSKFSEDEIRKRNDELIDMFAKVLDDEELERYEEGHDVYINHKRFSLICSTVTN